MNEASVPLFICDVQYDYRHLEAERDRLKGDLLYVVNSGFLKGLSRAGYQDGAPAPDAAADELERTVKNFGLHGALVNGANESVTKKSGALWQPRPESPIHHEQLGHLRTSTVATNTLDAVRQQLAAEAPELRRRGVRHLAVFGSVACGAGSTWARWTAFARRCERLSTAKGWPSSAGAQRCGMGCGQHRGHRRHPRRYGRHGPHGARREATDRESGFVFHRRLWSGCEEYQPRVQGSASGHSVTGHCWNPRQDRTRIFP